MSFSTQPNEMLDMILNQTGIPLAQRMRLRAVSHRFRATLEDGLQQENSLVIRIVDLQDLKKFKRGRLEVQPNDLIVKVSNFTKTKAIDFIQRLFPRLTELAINSNSIVAWRQATELLGHFALTLTSLKVDGSLRNIPTRESVFRSLGEAINSLLNLSSLYLEHEMRIVNTIEHIYEPSFGHHLLPHLATTLSRLERFTFAKSVQQNQATFIAGSLSSRCTHLRLNLDDDSVDTFPFDDAINLTHLHLTFFEDSVLEFVRQLPQLTTLILCDETAPDLDTLLAKIPPLSQVTQVTFIDLYYSHPFEAPASKASTFPSVKQLTLQLFPICNAFNAMDYLSTLAGWFPKLSNCALHLPEHYHEEILSIHGDLPYDIKLLDNLENTTF